MVPNYKSQEWFHKNVLSYMPMRGSITNNGMSQEGVNTKIVLGDKLNQQRIPRRECKEKRGLNHSPENLD